MGTVRTEEFCKGAVRRASAKRQVADDLGIGLSTLNKWVTTVRRPLRHDKVKRPS